MVASLVTVYQLLSYRERPLICKHELSGKEHDPHNHTIGTHIALGYTSPPSLPHNPAPGTALPG